MPVKLFNLRNVPDDEQEEIRSLLNKHGIAFYQTPAGNWGISSPAIWLKNDDELDNARQILDHYQVERQQRVRQEYEQLKRTGNHKTLGDSFRQNPLRFIVYLLIVAGLLYISIKPFMSW